MDKDNTTRKLKFYGLNDYGTFFDVKRVEDYLDSFDENKTDYRLAEIIELYNVLQFVDNGIFSNGSADERRAFYKTLSPKINKVISLFFGAIDESSTPTIITEIEYNYRQDLIFLLSKYKVQERVAARTLLSALVKIGVSISEILESKYIVTTYDPDIRLLILSDPQNAEQIIYKYLEVRDKREVYLPTSLTPDDARNLLDSYIDSDKSNPNYLKLIAEARVNDKAGIDAKLKLKAKRKYDATTEEFFNDDRNGMTYGCEVSISGEQEESLIVTKDGLIHKYSYSKKWLEQNSAAGQAVNNFAILFGFVREGVILNMPSYNSELGVFERFIGVKGKDSYLTGIAFESKRLCALSHTALYEKFLQTRDSGLEDVIFWFFEDHLNNQFKAEGFKYTPSSKTSTYLEKSRHLFTEMESLIKQFSLYVENGEIDKDLLAITSDQVRYHNIPSFVPNKYTYIITDNEEIRTVQYFMFSDQSSLGYINDTLQATSLLELLETNEVKYEDFLDYQKPKIDRLISLGVLVKITDSIKFRSKDQITALKNLFAVEAISYYHHAPGVQSEINDMINRGWLTRKTSLLTDPEASYFNYVLNQQEFSDGYDLRNKYLHGSQADKDNESAHYTTYMIALKLMISLIIKINDDFLLRDSIKSSNS